MPAPAVGRHPRSNCFIKNSEVQISNAYWILWSRKPGEKIKLTILRDDATIELTVTLAARRDWGDSADLCLHAIRARLTDPEQDLTADSPGEGLHDLLADLKALEQYAEQANPEVAAGYQMFGHRCRGDLALIQGCVSDAAESYEQALNHCQDYSAAWVGLAECARLAGDRKRALRLYLRAVTASEWNVQAWDRGCTLMEELGFHDNAKSWQVKVLEHFPERATTAGEPEMKPQMV